jgi:hypothetical protein
MSCRKIRHICRFVFHKFHFLRFLSASQKAAVGLYIFYIVELSNLKKFGSGVYCYILYHHKILEGYIGENFLYIHALPMSSA